MTSMAALALRICAHQAMINRTFAGARVSDSDLQPIENMAADDALPFVVISTGDEKGTVTGREILSARRTIDLVLEIGIATIPDGENIEIPRTDAGLELMINIVARQCMEAIFGDTEKSEWTAHLSTLITNVSEVESRRGLPVDHGTKFAARQIILRCETLDDPQFGAAPVGFWAEFIASMKTKQVLEPIASTVESVIIGSPIDDWDAARVLAAIRPETAGAIGIGAVDDPSAQPVLMADGALIDGDE